MVGEPTFRFLLGAWLIIVLVIRKVYESQAAVTAKEALKTDRDNNGVHVATLAHRLANAPSLAAAATTTDAVTTRVAMHLQAGTTPTTTTETTTTPATTTRTGVTVAVPTTSRNAQRAAAEGFAARREACKSVRRLARRIDHSHAVVAVR